VLSALAGGWNDYGLTHPEAITGRLFQTQVSDSFSLLFSKTGTLYFSTLAATAPENPLVVKISRSIKRETPCSSISVKPPSCFPSRFIRSEVKHQFVSDDVVPDPKD